LHGGYREIILIRITEGKGELADLEKLQQMGQAIKDGALCGLGQTAPNPVLSTLRYFRHEYETHITDKVCPAGVCKALAPGEKPAKSEAAEA
jgi:NADH:ubiquinone oxidoreductase subunit F (NADH-binding)